MLPKLLPVQTISNVYEDEINMMFLTSLSSTSGTLSQIWYGRPQETLLFEKRLKMYVKHMEHSGIGMP